MILHLFQNFVALSLNLVTAVHQLKHAELQNALLDVFVLQRDEKTVKVFNY